MRYSRPRTKQLSIIFFLLVICTCLSCRVNKNIPYFKDISDSLYAKPRTIDATQFTNPKIQPNDIIQVSILTLDEAVNTMLLSQSSAFSVQPSASSGGQIGAAPVSGFLVDKDGQIELPIIGKIKLGGLTTAKARDTIHQRVAIFYKDPVVNVKFTNFSVTVLGEVKSPATYIVPNEKVSILDAIGLAGDLTIFGKRENVLLIRDSSGQKQFTRFNLNSASIVKSPYFYLRQGDLVYVEPNKSRVEATDDPKRYANIGLALALATLIITILK
jgi:polysaccharide export outer membrane protein